MEEAKPTFLPSSSPEFPLLPSSTSPYTNPNTQSPTFHTIYTYSKQTQSQPQPQPQQQQSILQQSQLRTPLPPQSNHNRQQTPYEPFSHHLHSSATSVLRASLDMGVPADFGASPFDHNILQQQQLFSRNSVGGQCQVSVDLNELLATSNIQEFAGLGCFRPSLGSSSSPSPNTIQGSQLHQHSCSLVSPHRLLARPQSLPCRPLPSLPAGPHQQQIPSVQQQQQQQQQQQLQHQQHQHQQLSNLHHFQEHSQQYMQPRITQYVPHQLQSSRTSGLVNQNPPTSTTLQTGIQSGYIGPMSSINVDAAQSGYYILDKRSILKIIAQSQTELLTKLGEEKSTHQQRVMDLEAEVNSQARVFSNLKKERDDQAVRITVLEAETESQTKLFIKHDKERITLQQQIRDLEAVADSKARAFSNLEKERNDLVARVADLESVAESQTELLSKLDEEKSTVQQRVRDLEAEVHSQALTSSNLEKERVDLVARVSVLETQAESQAQAFSSLEKERSDLVAHVTAFESMAEFQSEVLFKHNREKSTLQQRVRDLEAEADSQSQAFDILKKERDALRKQHVKELVANVDSHLMPELQKTRATADLYKKMHARAEKRIKDLERFTRKVTEIVAWFDSRSRELNVEVSRAATIPTVVVATCIPQLEDGERVVKKRRFDGDGSNGNNTKI